MVGVHGVAVIRIGGACPVGIGVGAVMGSAVGFRVWIIGLYYFLTAIFCFSSRSRHTRFDCDWSSDVCSSDLTPPPTTAGSGDRGAVSVVGGPPSPEPAVVGGGVGVVGVGAAGAVGLGEPPPPFVEIGRASWRERG